MDFTQNEDQRELAALTRKILADLVTHERLREVEAGGDRFDPALWADLASSGVLAAALPQAADGAGLGLLEQCAVLTEIGRAVAPAPYLASVVLGAGAIARFGTAGQPVFIDVTTEVIHGIHLRSARARARGTHSTKLRQRRSSLCASAAGKS